MNDHPDYNESRYFNFHDQGSDLTGFMRIGMKPNRSQKSLFFFLMRGNEVMGVKTDGDMDDDLFRFQGMDFTPLGDDRWRLRYQGNLRGMDGHPHDVHMDLTWNPLNKEFDYRECVSGMNVDISAKVASEHYEQFGRLTGEVSIDGSVTTIDGRGERDHSRGVRDWGAPRSWLWINSQFSDDEAFNMTKLEMDQGTVDSGFFHTGGVSIPLVGAEAHVERDADGVPSRFTLNLLDGSGKAYYIEGRVVKKAFMPFDGSGGTRAIIVETLSEYSWEGRTGTGIAEFLFRL